MKKSKKMTLLYLSLILVLFVLVYFVFFYYEKVETLTYGGYYLSGTDIKKNLDDLECTEKVKLEYVEDYSTLYKKNDKFYANKDKEILIDYPGYSKDENRIINYNDNVNFIDYEFEKTSGYQNTILNERKIYNGVNLSSIDDLEYLFIEYETLYVNSTVMKIGNKEIPEYSIISFNNDYLSFYYKDGENLKLERILNIGNKDQVEFYMVLDENGNTIKINYADLLVKLNLKNEEIEYDVNKEILIREIEDIIIDSKPKKKDDKNYEKPTVTISNIVTDTYSIELDINVIDRTHQIKKNPTIDITLNDGTYLRKTAKGDGHLLLTGLLPNTEFGIIGTYTYYDKEGSLFLATFYNGKITTKDIDQVGFIVFNTRLANPAKKQIVFNDIVFTNESDPKALYGVKKVELELGSKVFTIGANSVNRLKVNQSINFESPNSLESNTEYEGKFVVTDLAGNIMKVKNNTLTYHTSKEVPEAILEINESDITYFVCDISYKNPDDAVLTNLRYDVYDSEGILVSTGELKDENQSIKVSDLTTNQIYRFVVYGDFDLLDGEGTRTNNILGETKISTTPIASLGYGNVIFEHVETFIDSDTYTMGLNASMIDEQLLSLMTGLKFIVRDTEENIVDEFTIDDERIDELLHNQSIDIKFSNLESNSDYTLEVITIVTQGTTAYELITVSNLTDFKTIKKDAYVVITEPFINESVIDFDAQIIDVDDAIDGDVVTIKVRDYDHKLILLKTLNKNSDPEEIYIDKLEKDKEYTITFEVEEYNTGLTKATAVSNKILLEKTYTTTVGLSGSIRLESLKKQVTSNNIYDITDLDAWKWGTSDTETDLGTELNLDKNYIKLKTKNKTGSYLYYVGNYLDMPLKISFYAKTDLYENSDNYARLRFGDNEKTVTLTSGKNLNEWKYFEFDNITISSILKPYINFEIVTTNDVAGALYIKDLFITSYNMTPNSITDSEYYGHVFEHTSIKSGAEQMPSYTNSSMMEGNANNGYARITNLSNGDIYKYEYTGSEQMFIVPETGNYLIETWGAQGGLSYVDKGTSKEKSYEGGHGAYASGYIELNKNEILYVVVGGKGATGNPSVRDSLGGYNGGGNGTYSSGGGGGATDIRLLSTGNSRSINSRIMVAAGGAGGYGVTNPLTGKAFRYDGGGIVSTAAYSGLNLTPAGQTNGYQFGQGESQTSTKTGAVGSGGGGGWYGGVTRKSDSGNIILAATGGSSYISGHYGCIAERLHKTYRESFLTQDKYKAKNKLVSTLLVSLNDINEEITNKEYYVEILENDVQVLYETYTLNKSNIIDETIYQELDKNQQFTINLWVEIRGKKFKLDTLSFDSKGEIKTIYTLHELINIHEYGRYLVGADITTTPDYRRVVKFNGYLDFQGHSVTSYTSQGVPQLFYILERDAVIKNLVIESHRDHLTNSTLGSIFYQSRGLVENVIVNLHVESGSDGHELFAGIGYSNMGTVRNFVVNLLDDVSLLTSSGLAIYTNTGKVENGYVFSENGSSIFTSNIILSTTKYVGGVVGHNNANGILRNVFSTVDILVPSKEEISSEFPRKIGNLAGYASQSYAYNNFSYLSEKSSTARTLTYEPNFYNKPQQSINNYYITDIPFNTSKSSNTSKKASKTALWSTEFYNNTVNVDGHFDVDNYVPFGYYPQLILPDCMPNQPLMELPRVNVENMFEVVTEKVLEDNWDDDTSTVEISMKVPTEDFEFTGIEVESMGFEGGTNTSHPYLDYEILEQSYKNEQITAKILFKNPMRHTTGYSILRIIGKMGASTMEKRYNAGEHVLGMSFYNKINNEDDFVAIAPSGSNNQNFVLKTDLDLANYVNKLLTNGDTAFNGIFEGEGHTIWNMKSTDGSGIFAKYFGGKLRNINFENCVETAATYNSYVGLMHTFQNGAEATNVHINNLNLVRTSATTNTGGLAALISYGTVTDTSITNLTISGTYEVGEHVGGIAGIAQFAEINNSFVSGMNIDTTSYAGFLGVGGLAGKSSYSRYVNCYAEGTINASSQGVGGIIGYDDGNTLIQNSYANVKIFNTTSRTGGIAGNYNGMENNPNNALFVGELQSGKIDDVYRIVGNLQLKTNNYAFEEQHLNGFPSEKNNGEIILTRDELNDKSTYVDQMGWSEEHWDFSNIGDNSLPLLKRYNSDEILPNQTKNYLPTYDLEVESIETSAQVNNANITIVIKNPSNKDITDIELNGLIINHKTIYTGSGKTTIVLEVKPSLYLDQYSIKRVTYKEGDSYKFYNLSSIINLQFYKYIRSYEDWQGISKTVAENYKLVADIDFTGKSNLNKEVVVNRLEGLEGHNYELKNIDINVLVGGEAHAAALINSAGYIKNITFSNINIMANANNTGIIRFLLEEMDGVEFNNVTINKDKPNFGYIGAICQNKGKLNNINLYSMSIYGENYVGALAAYTEKVDFSNINIYSSSVIANELTSTYVGGLIGYRKTREAVTGTNVHGENLTVIGRNYVGGLYGYNVISNTSSVNNIYVKGNNSVGGICGEATGYSAVKYLTGTNMRIDILGQYGAGLIGHAGGTQYFTVKDSFINGSSTSRIISGIAGTSHGWTVWVENIENSIVKGGTYVGGVDGIQGGPSLSRVVVYSTTVYGYDKVGGVFGSHHPTETQQSTTGSLNTVNATVIAKGSNVGGFSGYNETDNITSGVRVVKFYNNIVANTTVRGYGNVGGFIGLQSDILTSSMHQNYYKDTTQDNYIAANIGTFGTPEVYTDTVTFEPGGINNSGGLPNNDANKYRTGYLNVDQVESFTVTASNIYHEPGNTQSDDYYVGIYMYASNGSYYSKLYLNGTKYGTATGVNTLVTGGTYPISILKGISSSVYYFRVVVFTNDPSTINFELTRPNKYGSSAGKTGLIVGSGDHLVNGSTRMYVYSGSIINGEYATASNHEGILSSQYIGITKNDFKKATNTSSEFNYDLVDQGYYPLPKSNPTTARIPLPGTGGVPELEYNLNSVRLAEAINDNYYMEMPDTVVYPSSENTVNLEFSKTDGFTVIVGEKHYIPETVMTFNYNYTDDFKYSIYDGLNTIDYVIKADDLSKKLYVDGDNYYYIENGNIKGNTETISGDYIHIFDGIAIDSSGNTFDLKERTKDRVNYSNLTKVETKPIIEYDKKNNNIKSYAFHSLVNGNMYEKQIIIKNENTTLIGENYKTKPTNMIVDSYNDKEYLLILGNDNRIYSYKDEIKYPSSFVNRDIIEISSNYNNNSKLIMCRYSDGGILVFNYFNGKIILDLRKNESDFKSFISSMFMNTYDLTETSYSNQYKESKKFIKELEKTSIESVVDDEIVNYDRDYELVYNPSKDSFDVYEANTYIETSKSIRNNTNDTKYNEKSINDILYSDYKLSDNYKHLVITKNNFNIVGIISFILILFVAVIILAILKKNLKVKKAK